MKSLIYVNYLSRFANNIFQCAFAHIVEELVGGEIVYSPLCVLKSGPSHDRPAVTVPIEDIPLLRITDSHKTLEKKEWSGKFTEAEKEAVRKTGVCFAEDVVTVEDGSLAVSDFYRAHPGIPIIVSGYYQDYRYFRGRKEFISGLLRGLERFTPRFLPGKDDIVLNFRGTDLSFAQMPLNYYRWILDKERFDTLWIVTEDPRHKTVRRLLETYPSHVLSNGPIEDLRFVMSARKILMSVSTFCWMAAWLSEAEKIYFPVGSAYPVFDKNDDRRLIVGDDRRYIYIRSIFDNPMLRGALPCYYECSHEMQFPTIAPAPRPVLTSS